MFKVRKIVAILALYQIIYFWKIEIKNEVCACMFKAKFLFWFYIITGNDISKPLKNSFIHTGHGDPGGKSWGDPAAIDE